MAYVAARGGEQAIQAAEQLYQALNGPLSADLVRLIEQRLPYLVDRVMGEGSLYAPELAALAIAQTGGDLYEAVLLLRAYRATQPRLAYAAPVRQAQTLTVRRISAAFKDIPGGQILGPTLDYSHRLLRLDLLDDQGPRTNDQGPTTDDRRPTTNAQSANHVTVALDPDGGPAASIAHEQFVTGSDQEPMADEHSEEHVGPSSFVLGPSSLPALADWHRANGLLDPLPERGEVDPAQCPDVTREPIGFPAPRAHRLQSLARADTGGVLALGYASMRGYGLAHPTVNEVRLAYADVVLRHPVTGAPFSAGRVRVSQAEVVNTGGGPPTASGPTHSVRPPAALRLGFTATLGWNEVKTIAGSMLDLEMDADRPHPAHQEEFVLYHTEPVEASGFCIHYKLPHYVTFQSGLDAVRGAVRESGAGGRESGDDSDRGDLRG